MIVRQLPLQTQHACREPLAEPNQQPDKAEKQTTGHEDAEDVPHQGSGAIGGIEGVVRIEALRGIRDICQADIAHKEEGVEDQMDPRRSLNPADEDFEECKPGVQHVYGDL